jgi:bifunctional UDP-N-acetylglucosamine pyrophosphorylase/glucosamine-1-phosphate N-acetyltransferase
LGKKIQEYFGDSYAGRKISYLVQEKLDGSGGAIALAKNFLKDDFLVMNGDDLYKKEDIEKLASFDLAVLTMEIENASQFGTVSINEDGNLNGIVERQAIEEKALVNTGLYKLNKDFFKYKLVSIGNGEFGLPQTLVTMKDKYAVKTINANDWFAIGNSADLKKAENIIDKFI